MNLISGDLVKIDLNGEPRFGQFERYGRDGKAIIDLGGSCGKARVRPMEIVENRSEDARKARKRGQL